MAKPAKSKKLTTPEKPAVKAAARADWWPRFWAWLVDMIIVGAILGLVGFPQLFNARFMLVGGLLWPFILFFYWTVFEHYREQSIGKMALGIKVTNIKGGRATLVQSAVQAFGKAFLLPLDCLVGWFAMSGEKLRLFNKVSDTMVVRK